MFNPCPSDVNDPIMVNLPSLFIVPLTCTIDVCIFYDSTDENVPVAVVLLDVNFIYFLFTGCMRD